jgi:hypothetical protein
MSRKFARTWHWFGFAVVLGSGCTGYIRTDVDGDEPSSAAGSGAKSDAGSDTPKQPAADGGTTNTNSPDSPEIETPAATSALPRLSHRQWALTAQDLLALDSAPDVSGFSNDPPSATGFDNTGAGLAVSQGLFGDYQTLSEQLAEQVASDSAKLAKVLPASLPSSGDARVKAFVEGFGARAFRRPLTTAESSMFVALFKQGPSLVSGRDELAAGAQITIQTMLQAPDFGYRIEGANPPGKDGVIALNDYEIASRLSYMLWDSLPDAALFAAAKSGALHTPEQLSQQAERMLKLPRAADKLDEFHRQLLELRRYDTLRPQGLPDGIGVSLRQETERFVHDALIDREGSVADLFTAHYSFVNKDLAGIYGLSGNFDSELVRSDLDATRRSGLLTQPGFLIYRSGDTAPILRGVFVNQKFLCAELPPPPVFTPPKQTGTTRRERIESITGKGTCGEGCHASLINPAGYPLENFDDQGRYRTQDNGQPVDAAASYTFADGASATYNGPIEWGRALAMSRQAHACYVRHWLEFGFGRNYAAGDKPLVERVADASLNDQASVKELLVALVESPSFRSLILEKP